MQLHTGQTKHKKWLKISLLCSFFGALILWNGFWYYNTFTAPFDRDEGEYSYSAWLLNSGDSPYVEAFMQKPPMIIYTYSLAQLISDAVWAPRLLAVLAVMFAALILADIVRRNYGSVAAVCTAFLFTPYAALPWLGGYSSQPEVFLLAPFSLALWSYYRQLQHPRPFFLFLLGVCLTTAFLYKQIVLVPAIFIVLYLLYQTWRAQHALQRVILSSWYIAAGAMVALITILLPIYARGGLSAMWESAFVYNWYYAHETGFQVSWVLQYGPVFFLFFFVTASLLCWLRPPHWLFLLVILLASIIGTGLSRTPHYYIITIPLLVLAGSVCINALAQRLERYVTASRYYTMCVVPALSIAVLLLVLNGCIDDEYMRLRTTPEKYLTYRFPDEPFTATVELSRVLSSISTPKQQVFIYGNEAQILYYTKKRSATRFVITYPLYYVNTPLNQKYQNMLIQELTQQKPDFIISEGLLSTTTPPKNTTYDQFISTLIAEYRLVGTERRVSAYESIYQQNQGDPPKDVMLALYARSR